MNMGDLNKFDIKELKSFDINQAKEFLISRVDVTINLILVVLTILGVTYLYSDGKAKLANLEAQIQQMKEKLEMVKGYEDIKKKHDDFKNAFPKYITSDQLTDKISAFAGKNNVKILSFSPAQKKEEEFWTTTSVNINVSAANYASIIEFMQDIEKAPFAIQVQKWSGRFSLDHSNQQQAPVEENTEAYITIGSVNLKNE